MKRWHLVAAIATSAPLLVYLALFNHVEPSHAGLAWNRVNGDLWLQDPGMHFSPPWVAVSIIDLRPQRVCLTTSGRGFNCKLMRFVPIAFKEFAATEGHRYYWWANRLSFNSGYSEEYRGMKDLLRGYAFGTAEYPFIVIMQDSK